MGMKILFLDQSGKPGGAELCLLDLVSRLNAQSKVGLFEDGSFRALLEQANVPVEVFGAQALQVRKDSGILKSLMSIRQVASLVSQVSSVAKQYDAIYANTPKALVIGALAALMSRRALIYHLHDIISADHFSTLNRRLLVGLSNRLASLVIANSEASQAAFIDQGGNPSLVSVVYNGFNLENYPNKETRTLPSTQAQRQNLGWDDRFIVGHFSRLSPWKGQHVLLQALSSCPDEVSVVLVGDALFGETGYVKGLHEQVQKLGIQDRVKFLGFRSDVSEVMAACDLIVHSSTAPEPFGRVIVEAMLCDRPVIAAAAGGAMELVQQNKTGWLCSPNDGQKLAELITFAYDHPEVCHSIATEAKQQAKQRFSLESINAKITALLTKTIAKNNYKAVDISNLSEV